MHNHSATRAKNDNIANVILAHGMVNKPAERRGILAEQRFYNELGQFRGESKPPLAKLALQGFFFADRNDKSRNQHQKDYEGLDQQREFGSDT